ncbi:hypothetical protein LOK49_LG11G00982 [Camellia lanceoleosa]|uniref:Uncharacterized protein n=1 Tax=Camellia lanceoleosa TaxID=1840588 RepID=A0ACC0G673_9ERIC|nr:hypothetical protein LOK49_LG11G00982 [Camellia lanceoleosa]
MYLDILQIDGCPLLKLPEVEEAVGIITMEDVIEELLHVNSRTSIGSPILGYLTAVILIGPYGLFIIHHVHGTKAIAEFEVVFLMFNIALELSVERLSSMKKYVFGLGCFRKTSAGNLWIKSYVAVWLDKVI